MLNHQKPEQTPLAGQVHEVPPEAVEVLQAVWVRIKMAGIEFARMGATNRRFGWASATLTAVTSLGVFTTLQTDPSVAARTAVGIVTAVAAVLTAWQTRASEQAQAQAGQLSEILHEFIPLKEELLSALSSCRLYGHPVDDELVARARKALNDHTLSSPGEFPAFDEASAKVEDELVDLQLLVRKRC